MAVVYLAEDLRHHRNVALKVLKPELAAVVGGERFLSEIETTAKLTHPRILPLHDSGEADWFLDREKLSPVLVGHQGNVTKCRLLRWKATGGGTFSS